MYKTINALSLAAVAIALGACTSFVQRDEYETTLRDLRDSDARLATRLALMDVRLDRLTDELGQAFEKYDASIARLQGRLRIDITAHFDHDDATLKDQHKGALAEFSRVVADYHPDVLVTVEGFTDPAGAVEYNRKLGLRRAVAVRDFLVASGLEGDAVRAVSYGEDANRQIVPGATGQQGVPNRRVALVIDHVPGALTGR